MKNAAKSTTRVLIVDDHPVVLSGCRSLFASDSNVKIDEATDARSGHRAYFSRRPDVTVIDIKLPDVSGFELMRRIRKDDPDAKIIMFSMNDDPAFVVRAIELGAQGYVSKGDDPRMLVKAVRKVAAGDNFISPPLAEAVTFSGASIKANPASQMTARELEILRLLGRGDKIVEVADALEISYKTVANTTSLLKQKLGAKNHSDLIRIAVEMVPNFKGRTGLPLAPCSHHGNLLCPAWRRTRNARSFIGVDVGYGPRSAPGLPDPDRGGRPRADKQQ
jgi:DNA-binding NarL/FixJ family response regulator